MSWAKLDDGIFDHEKIANLSDGAQLAHVRGIVYCARNSGNPHRVAIIRLTQDPFRELSSEIPEEDWYAEGFEYAMAHDLRFRKKTTAQEVWDFWKAEPHYQWVVRFEIVEVVA